MNGIRWSKVEKSEPNTIIIICSGPSIANFNFENLRDMGYIITVNDAGKFVPFYDAWFTLDPWGVGVKGKQLPPLKSARMYAAVPEDYGLSIAKCNDHKVYTSPQVNYLHRIGFHSIDSQHINSKDYLSWGLNEDRRCINTGNSGYGALNLAFHMQPRHILFLGLDASTGYFYEPHKPTRSLNHLPIMFRSTIPQLKDKGIEVINASPMSKVDCFPRYTLPAAIKKLKEWKKSDKN